MKRKLVLFSFTYLRLGLGYVKPLGRILSQIGHFSSRLTSNLGADATQARQCVICVELLWETKIKKSIFQDFSRIFLAFILYKVSNKNDL